MGAAKRWMEEIERRGYNPIPDKYVCQDCVDEEAIKNFVRENCESCICSYCGKREVSPIAASVENVANLIVESIRSEWLMPEDSGTPYESKEGGWLIEPTATEDVLVEEGFDADEAIFEDIVGAIRQEYWLKEFSNPTPEIEILYDWETFCAEVKHRSRYVFFRMPRRDPYGLGSDDETTACGILDAVASYCSDFGLVKKLSAGEKLFRVRIDDSERYSSVDELGPPEIARYANRMSPAGVVMFYGAGDPLTCIAETASGRKDKGVASIGEFEVLRDMNVLDFTAPIGVPSIFDANARKDRVASMFMLGFLADFQREIAKDGMEHIDYVPTQIVTEYFRYLFECEGEKVLGVKYKSAQNESGISYVLFVDQRQCVEGKPDELGAGNAVLSLVPSSVRIAHVSKNSGGQLVVGAFGYWGGQS